MPVLLYAEHSNGTIKKAVFQAAAFARELADKMGTHLHAVALGSIDEAELKKLETYGVETIHHSGDKAFDSFNDMVHASAIAEAAKACNDNVVVFAQTYNGKAISPRLSIKMDASHLTSIISLPDPGNGFLSKKTTNSGKGIETIRATRGNVVITVKANAWKANTNPKTVTITPFAFSPDSALASRIVVKETVKASAKISITEADTVVSGGRGLKGPENWGILEELATALNAGTACSKPVADMDWRPHHEHVGQTGIQIAPNLYIALGISGAIQHLAGVNSSKNIVVINKDPEAPFFKIADYGIVGDVFEVIPKITARVKQVKASH